MFRLILVWLSIICSSRVLCNSPMFFEGNDVTRFFFASKLSCGGTTRLKKISMRSPSPIVNECRYTIKPSNLRVCQLRIDFNMVLAQPRLNGNQSYPKCLDDVFRINNIQLCGTNINQHIYIPFDVKRMNDAITIQLSIADRGKTSTLEDNVSWSATVRQLECPDKAFIASYNKLLAPNGCLQYHTERNGTIESFNFNRGNGPHLGNFSYAICIKRPSTRSALLLKTVAFELNKASPNGEGYDADCVTQINTIGASEDHISIAEAIKHGSNNIRASKFCGQSLQNSTITVDAAGPFVIHVHSDEEYDQVNNTERGFKFDYGTV